MLVLDLGSRERLMLPAQDVTNYSLAARRAWAVMPKRAGRPPSKRPRKRMISLRLDIELIARLESAVRHGFVVSKSDAMNKWIAERLDSLGIGARSRPDVHASRKKRRVQNG